MQSGALFAFVAALACCGLAVGAAVPSITVNATSIASEDWVKVTWEGIATADRNGCWIGVVSPPTADVSAIAPVIWPASPPWTKTAVIKYQECTADPSFNNTGSGTYEFSLINMRDDVGFVLFTGGIKTPNVVAKSEAVSFTDYGLPRQGVLALTGKPSEMQLVWNSQYAGADEQVKYTVNGGAVQTVSASTYTYTADDLCGLPAQTQGWRDPGLFHVAVMTGLAPSDSVVYWYGNEQHGWSDKATFKASLGPTPQTGIRVMLTADVGASEADQCHYHWEEPDAHLTYQGLTDFGGNADVLLHIGDIAYATGYAAKWDLFMTQANWIGKSVPIMVVQGNHEQDVPGNLTFYNGNDSGGECGVPTQKRFPMPVSGSQANGWYSFEVGPVHFVMMDTEMDCGPTSAQYKFFEADLAAVNRTNTPWIVFSGHRPMYSVHGTTSWTNTNLQQFEELLFKNQVDLCLWGHVHNAMVTCPLLNGTCIRAATEGAYDAPIHAVIGNGGQTLDPAPTPKQYNKWTTYAASEFGFSFFNANNTHLHMEMFSDAGKKLHHEFYIKRSYPRQ
eukprot:m.52550 g.52550  ORF g.52550 m.52550 type:complete len:561 (-) comp11312_c0_seq1:138-1820(-)